MTKVVTNVRITICDSHNSLPDPGGGLVLEEVFYRSRSIFVIDPGPFAAVGGVIDQGGRTWQPFVGSKNGNENFRQTHIYNFRVKCVVFARNRQFAKLTQ